MSTMHTVVAALLGAVVLAAAVAVFTAALARRRAEAPRTAARNDAVSDARRVEYCDPLTGLGNRAAFHRLMTARHSRRSTVILLNIDGHRRHLQAVGEQAFDDAITDIARRVRHEAAAAGADAFRLRRDEFAVVVPARALRGTAHRRGTTAAGGDRAVALAGALAGRLVAAVYAATAHRPAAVRMRARAGVTTSPGHDEPDGRLVLAWADAALRSAKRTNAAWVRHPAVPS